MIQENRNGGFHREEHVHEMGLIPSTRRIMERTGATPWVPPQRYDIPLTLVK